ncbi:MAG: DNA-methyltransferase, partial [Dolichospermum sp.]
MINQIIHGDCFEILRDIPDGFVDAVITDPPYGIGLAEWDSVVDIPLFTKEVKRVTNGFYAFFGQMPTMVNWINEANNEKLHYCEHISWVKRREMMCSLRLKRKHESIFIYAKDSTCRYYKQCGSYEDVKVPGVLFDVITIQSIQRAISDLKTGRESRICSSKHKGQFSVGKRNLTHEHRRIDGEDVNFTNVWSFMPPISSPGRAYKQSFLHPTEKPLEIMKRLVEMLTPEGGTVLDPFAGSGTTAVACKELGRNYICIEKEREYVDIIHQRLDTPITERGLTVEEQVEIEEKIKPSHQ